jgi:Tfp pilus assembly protein PilF
MLLLALVPSFAGSAAAADRAEVEVFVARAVAAYEAGRYDEAEAALENALRIEPDHVEALYYSGVVHAARGNFEAAAKPLERAHRLAPDDGAVEFQLGAVYFQLRRDDEASPLLERTFARSPSLDRLGYFVGVLRYRKGDYAGALRALEQARSEDPEVRQLTEFYRGLALVRLGMPERAAAQVEEALKLSTVSPVTATAERLRQMALATRLRERRFGLQVQAGGFYDDNVAVSPELSDDPVVRELAEGDPSSPGVMAALRADYTFLRRGSFDANATYSFYSNWNTDLPQFDLMQHLGGLTGNYRGTVRGTPYQAALQYSYDYLTLDEDEFVGTPWRRTRRSSSARAT